MANKITDISFEHLGGYISDKKKDIHNQLYNIALNRYLDSIDSNTEEYKNSHVFNEIQNNEYWLPSKVIIKSTEEPYLIKEVDLSKYWDNYEYNKSIKKINEDFFQNKEDINAFFVIYIDYVNGKIKLKNKNSGKIIWKDIEYFKNGNIPIDEDELSLKGTFIYNIQKNN